MKACIPDLIIKSDLSERHPMKKATILLCTPNMQSQISRRCLDSLFVCTNNEFYKLIIVGNQWNAYFNRPYEMNKCLRTMDTEFFVCLDEDIILTPGWLEALLQVAEDDPSVGAVSCIHTSANGVINQSGGTVYSTGGALRSRPAFSPFSSVVYAPNVYSTCALFRRTSFCFNETYAECFFDVDYCYRLWETGFRVAVTPHKIKHPVDQQKSRKYGRDPEFIQGICQLDAAVFARIWYDSCRLNVLYREISSKVTHPDLKGVVRSKPISLGGDKLPEGMLLPLLVRERIKARQANGQRRSRIAIFGAGKHTAWLECIIDKTDDFPEIVAILDDSPIGKMPAFGLLPIDADRFDAKRVDAIILSSDCRQPEMIARCRELYGNSIKLVDLYEGLPPGPYNKA